MDLDAPVGTYEVDAFGDYFMGFAAEDPIQVRWAIERAGRVATQRAEQELKGFPDQRDLAVRLLQAIEPIHRIIPSLGEVEMDGLLAARLANAFEQRADQPIAGMIGRIIEGCRLIAASEIGLTTATRLKAAGPSNSDPLPRHYVALMWQHFQIARKEAPPSGRSGKFVDMIEAGWRDLGLPDRDDLDLGQKVEAHARSLRSLKAE